jgi:hypothetical protein
VRRLRLPWRVEEPPPETIKRSGVPVLRAAEDRANLVLGDLDVGVQRLSGEPAPVEADELHGSESANADSVMGDRKPRR